MKRFEAIIISSLLSLGAVFVAGCDSPGGDGTRWSCAMTYSGHSEGTIEGETSTARIVARLFIPPGEEMWLFEGVYEELEGPLDDNVKLQEFASEVDEDGNLEPAEAGIQLFGSIDLDGYCEAEGTWEFFGDASGTWTAAP